MKLLPLLCLSYFLGSLSTAIILCRLKGLPDPRQQGSGNPGASNIFRLGHKRLAALVLLGDSLKAILPLFLAKWFIYQVNISALAWMGVAVCLGHFFPIFFKFQGGKGVATALGSLLIISWPLALLALLIWLLLFQLFHYAALASMGAALGTIVGAYCFLPLSTCYPISLLAILVILRHWANIIRLWRRAELRVEN
jgi:acyl phosphate:glycerol-3-phosphate acyltransferase